MNVNVLLGIFLIGLGAFSSGSFAVPFGKIKEWKWETYWMVFSFGAYIIFPLVACLVFAPEFISIIKGTPSSVLISVFLLGAVYGIGNLSVWIGFEIPGFIAWLCFVAWFNAGYWNPDSSNDRRTAWRDDRVIRWNAADCRSYRFLFLE